MYFGKLVRNEWKSLNDLREQAKPQLLIYQSAPRALFYVFYDDMIYRSKIEEIKNM